MTTEERLAKLEQRNRLLLIGLVLAVVAFALGTRADEKNFNVIRANKFILEDESGKLRAAISVFEHKPALIMFGENGELRAVLGESGLRLYGADEKLLAILFVSEDEPRLQLFNENGKVRWQTP